MGVREPATNKLSRLRHRRGFGIHSPYAYTVVKNIIAPSRGYAYYCERRPEIMNADRCDREVRIARMLMRWCAAQGCRKVRAGDGVPALLLQAMTIAGADVARYWVGDNYADVSVIVLSAGDISLPQLGEMLADEQSAMIFYLGTDYGKVWAKVAGRDTGILFYSPGALMLIPYSKTKFTYYDIHW